MSEPTICVIVTCYNYEEYVSIAINSVLDQLGADDQLIVVDDCSSDASPEIIRSYGDKVEMVFCRQNRGAVHARVVGLRLARSKIILFLDADDFLDQRALPSIKATWRPGFVKVQFNLEIINAQGGKTGRLQCHFPAVYDHDEIAKDFAKTGTYIWPVTSGNAYSACFIRQVFGPGGLRPDIIDRLRGGTLSFDTDGLLNTLAPLFGSIKCLHMPLGAYRHHQKNLSRVNNEPMGNCPDFAKRILMRRGELLLLREFASAIGKRIPDGDLLDNETTFVDYRLIALKIGVPYDLQKKDTTLRLAARGVSLRLRTGGGYQKLAIEILWILSLFIAPTKLAKRIVQSRFNRTL